MVDDVLKRRFIQVGLFAWVILLSLAVTSPQRVLRWMGGKNWQRLHRMIYVAAVAAVMHFWWLVKAGVMRPWKDTLFWRCCWGRGWCLWRGSGGRRRALRGRRKRCATSRECGGV